MVLPATWYHSTQVDQWLEKVTQKNIWVHIGSRQAAIDRASRVTRQGYRVAQRTALHHLALNIKDLYIDPVTVGDIGDDWSENLDHTGYNAIKYVNEYEDYGSLSLLVSPRLLRVQRTQILLPSIKAQYRLVNA